MLNGEEIAMRRRDLLKAAAAGAAALAAPRIGRAQKANKLVFVPTEDLSVLDPMFTGPRSMRNYAYLVFDTLYGIDTSWMAQPQMVEGHQVEEDGLTWTLTLRDGLRFHDKEPVLARDVVASIRRFAARISLAEALMAATEELSATDDRTVRFRLKRPFPHLPEALAGPGGNVPAIMPERLAATSAFKPLVEIVGSGPSIASCPKSMSAAPAPPTNASRSTSRARTGLWASPPDPRSHISIGSSG
jgi:peptide/nickel transport system substrate-binding protein